MPLKVQYSGNELLRYLPRPEKVCCVLFPDKMAFETTVVYIQVAAVT